MAEEQKAGALVAQQRHAGEVTTLLQMAMERGVDVGVLERLVALKERILERDARVAYMAALAEFQRRCPVLRKDATARVPTKNGGEYTYTYTPLDSICRQINPLLEECGLSYAWTTREAAHPKVLVVVCRLRHVDGHEETAEFPVPTETTATMSGAQKVGSALTYGRRQSLVSVLGIVTGDEDDDAPEGRQGGTLSEEQVEALNHKLDEVGADFPRFMRYMGHPGEGLDAIPASDFGRAMRALDRKGGV